MTQSNYHLLKYNKINIMYDYCFSLKDQRVGKISYDFNPNLSKTISLHNIAFGSWFQSSLVI